MPNIITDGVHLCAVIEKPEELEALHTFAQGIGLKREWFQPDKRHPHYDTITSNMSRKAIRAGAQFVSTREIARLSLAGKLCGGLPAEQALAELRNTR